MANKKTVMLTGSSGTMGLAGCKELYKRRDEFNIVLLNRGSDKNRELFKEYENDPSVRLVWGDLTHYDEVLDAVNGADIVLHVGGMVSPAADYYPKKTIETNTTAMKNIVEAVKAQPDPDNVKVVYIGTVAQTGDRNPPIHWARTGDPIKISIYDHYAISKTIAERTIAESGLKHWVSLRQSGILYPGILKNYDPIMFHVPINGVLEWATVEDSGLLLANVCNDDVPEDFWRKFYNIGSGKPYRITNFEFEEYLLHAIGLSSTKKIFEPKWFTLRNFHGQYYIDSDKLDEILHFRHNVPIQDYFDNMSRNIPKYYHLAKIAPPFLVKKLGMAPLCKREVFGTMDWINKNDQARITAYYGSRENWERIGGWDTFEIKKASMYYDLLDHGYDESKPVDKLDIADMQKAAEFRGGSCESKAVDKNDGFYKPLKWKCAFGHEFEMSPNLVLKGGHWCPDCLPMPWNYDEIAKVNPFFAQVWYPLHDKDENNFYDESIFKDFKG